MSSSTVKLTKALVGLLLTTLVDVAHDVFDRQHDPKIAEFVGEQLSEGEGDGSVHREWTFAATPIRRKTTITIDDDVDRIAER